MKLLQELLESLDAELQHECEGAVMKFAQDVATALKSVDKRIKEVKVTSKSLPHLHGPHHAGAVIKADPIKDLRVSGQIENYIVDHEGKDHIVPIIVASLHLELFHKPDDFYKKVVVALKEMLKMKYNRDHDVFSQPWYDDDHNSLSVGKINLGKLPTKFFKPVDAKRTDSPTEKHDPEIRFRETPGERAKASRRTGEFKDDVGGSSDNYR